MRKIKPHKMEKETSLDMPKEMYPHFGISLEHLPEAKKWEVGKTYYITLEMKQTGMTMRKDYSDASFDITGIEVNKDYKKNYKELPDKE